MSSRSGLLLCWHAQRAGIEVLERAIEELRKHKVSLCKVLYLVQRRQPPDVPRKVLGVAVETIQLPVDDPTRHAAIYQLLRERVLPQVDGSVGPLHINVSPGTPAMHAVWLILHAGGAFPAGTRLWSSQYSQEARCTRIDPVEFEISTYLAEIRAVQRSEPKRAAYDPEAKSPARRAALERLERYAQVGGAPLLILGERGIGKTRLVETFIATLKQRNTVVTVACGGLDSSLADSLLFGHLKGAFTGAEAQRPGLLSQADGGILFLDEVQDLPATAQRKLVRVFQDRQRRFRPVGSDEETKVDVDLVCASNLPIADLRKQLDADLFDRLSHLTVRIPPLRECRQDLEDDWAKVWREVRLREDLPEQAPWPPAIERALAQHALPGNLRDLQRLAVLLVAWWTGHERNSAARQALDEWHQWTLETSVEQSEFGSGSRDARIKRFRGRLARWARQQYKTWSAAGQALDCNEKTLRDDAGLPDDGA